jgi:hypothetical protein
MYPRHDPLRASIPWLSPLLGLLLLFGAWALGVHQHRGERDHGTCVACSASQASAVVADAAPTPAGFPARGERPVATPEVAPPRPAAVSTPRAPPLG